MWGLVRKWILTHVPMQNPHVLLEFSGEDQGFLNEFIVLLVWKTGPRMFKCYLQDSVQSDRVCY